MTHEAVFGLHTAEFKKWISRREADSIKAYFNLNPDEALTGSTYFYQDGVTKLWIEEVKGKKPRYYLHVIVNFARALKAGNYKAMPYTTGNVRKVFTALNAIIGELTEEKEGTEWEHILKNLNRKKMCNLIKEKCAYHTYKDSMEILYRELDKMYRNGVGRVIAEKVTEHFRSVMAFETMSSEKSKWGVFFPIYNTGAGNATDVQIKWDFSKNYHRELCSNLGFTDNEYEDMLKYFSLDTIEVAEAEVMLNTNGDNIFRVQVPGEVLLLIENLYLKKIKNCKEEKYENNNALVGEHKFAELHINCKDIYGENHYFDYCVMFFIQPTMWTGYGYQEERFYLKFDNVN